MGFILTALLMLVGLKVLTLFFRLLAELFVRLTLGLVLAIALGIVSGIVSAENGFNGTFARHGIRPVGVDPMRSLRLAQAGNAAGAGGQIFLSLFSPAAMRVCCAD